MSEPTEAEVETPYARYRRLRAEGHGPEVIAERMRATGASDDDLAVLRAMEAKNPVRIEAATGPLVSGVAMTAGALLVGGPLVAGLAVAALEAAATEAAEAKRPREALRPLDPADPSPRCAQHPTFAAQATCARCGSFLCRDCQGAPGATACVRCLASPTMRQADVRRAGRFASGAIAGQVALLLMPFLYLELPAGQLRLALVGAAIAVLPLLLLGVTQFFVASPWPAFVCIGWSALLALWEFISLGPTFEVLLTVAGLVAQIAMTAGLLGARRSPASLKQESAA